MKDKSTLQVANKCRQLFYTIDLSIEYFFIIEISKHMEIISKRIIQSFNFFNRIN